LSGGTFDGSTEIGFDHLDWSLPGHSRLKVGNIRALAVSSPGRETPEPADRVVSDVVDFNGLFTYGAANGGRIGFRNNPVLGTSDFQVTLRDADAGMWAMLYMGSPIPAPGVSLPPSVSTSMLLLAPNSLVPVYSASQTVGGATERTLPIPTTPGLAGASFGFQWVVFMPLTLPVTLSNGGVVSLR
jgi:hypothetical protein